MKQTSTQTSLTALSGLPKLKTYYLKRSFSMSHNGDNISKYGALGECALRPEFWKLGEFYKKPSTSIWGFGNGKPWKNNNTRWGVWCRY
jgi:hypothetical protein